MVNTNAFRERLEKILSHYDVNATAFAEEIGVQRSSISHLLSGRNKPSLDFVLKVIRRYPEVDLYWLLNGKGSFPAMPDPDPAGPKEDHPDTVVPCPQSEGNPIEKVMILYADGSFKEYTPVKDS